MKTKKQLIDFEHKGNEKHSFKLRPTLLSLCMLTFIGGYSQTGQVNLNLKNATVKELFREIEKQTSYRFSYRDIEINNKGGITISGQGKELKEVLTNELAKQQLSYTVSGNKIIVSPAKKEATSTKDKKVTGKVVDAKGEPVIGATIMEKGTTNGTITDFDGNFTLNVSDNSMLEVSYVGYQTQSVKAISGKNLAVTLKEDTELLDEVVVVGYGVQKKVNLTGAVASIKSNDILKSQSANTSNAIIGQLPGLIAKQATGEPGMDNSSLFIRGVATFSGSTAPTFIIDGIERQAEDFSRIDPNEIESLNILKDAASAAIFGMRGANGVILVTTKRGNTGKINVKYSSNVSIQSPTCLPQFANSYDFARYKNDYMGSTIYTNEEIQKFADGSDPEKYPNTDWYSKMLTKNAIQHQHSITVSGGKQNIKFFTSFGFVDQGGLWDNLSYKRYSMRSNIDVDLTKTTKLSVDLSGRVEYRNGSIQSSTDIFEQLIRNTPVLLDKYLNGLPTVPDSTHPNIIELSKKECGYNNSRNNSILSRIELAQDLSFITKGLKIKGIFSYDKNNYSQKIWSVAPYLYVRDTENNYILQPRGSAMLSQTQNDNEYIEWQGQLTYERSFNKHSLSGLLMTLGHKSKYHNLWASRSSFDSDVMDQISAGNSKGQQLGGYDTETARLSYVGRINYNYNSRYLFEANIRRDASENFAPDKRWGTFASISLGWVISEEKFFERLKDNINFLKIRGSYGTLGNDNTGGISFPYYSRFELYNGRGNHSGNLSNNLGDYVFGNLITKGLGPGAIANPNATWEKSNKLNIALDAGFFNMVNLSIDLFKEIRSDILAQRSAEVPGSFGGILPLENIGKVENKGIDANIIFNHQIGKVRYTIGSNFTFARNKILEMAEAKGTSDLLKRTGRPIHSYYGYKTDGIFQSPKEIDSYAKQEVVGSNYITQVGDIKYVDVTGDGIVNANDMTYLGYGNIPEIIYGINGGLSWNNFDFNFLFQGAGHVQVYLNGGVIMPYFNDGNLPQLWVDEAWSEENKGNRYPKLAQSNHNFPDSSFSPVETYLYNASYLRLKNIEIGYNFPKKWLNHILIENARIYVSGQNLLTFTQVPQIDPENTHSSGWTYPQMKSFNIGINIQF